MKRILGVILAIIMIFAGSIGVKADEVGATFAYKGVTNAKVGEYYSLDVVIKDVKGEAITGAAAFVDYDKEYLEFVSINANPNSPLAIFTNLNTVKFAGLSLTGEGITEQTTILTIVFKPIKEGNTTLGFSELDLCDTRAKTVEGQMEQINLTIEGKKANKEVKNIVSNKNVETKAEVIKENSVKADVKVKVITQNIEKIKKINEVIAKTMNILNQIIFVR